jgi:hypothetical protein
VPQGSRPPSRLVAWWEGLETGMQILIAFPVLAVLLLAVNLGPFGLSLPRSLAYAVFEGGVLTGLLIVATINERNRRKG